MIDDTPPVRRSRPVTQTASIVTPPDRFSALKGIADQAEKSYGLPVVTRGNVLPGFTYLETGVFMLDYALLGGIPEGQVSMLYGWESSGKTMLAMRVAAATQRKYPDRAVVYVDAEQSFDATWAEVHGIDTERLFLVQPVSAEQTIDMIDAVMKTPETAIVIVDSLPALVPQVEMDNSASDAIVAKRAQLIGRLCSKILGNYNEQKPKGNEVTVLFINQFRTKIGVVNGDPRVLPGGSQPKYLSTTMIECKNKEFVGADERGINIALYNDHEFVIKKSKIGNSLRSGAFTMIRDPHHHLGSGAIDDFKQAIVYGKKQGLVVGGGASWRYSGNETVFRTMDAMAEHFEDNPEEYSLFKRMVISDQRVRMGISAVPPDDYLLGRIE